MNLTPAVALPLLLQAAAAFGAGGGLVWLWQRRGSRLVSYLTAAVTAVLVWSLSDLLRVLITRGTVALALVEIGYVAAFACGVFIMLFAVEFTNNQLKLTKPVWAALGAVSAIVAGVALTNGLHDLIWNGVTVTSETYPGAYGTASAIAGPVVGGASVVYWVAYGILALPYVVGGAIIASRLTDRPSGWFRVVGVSLLLLGTSAVILLTALELAPAARAGYPAVSAAITTLVAVYVVNRGGLTTVAPYTREDLVESVGRGIIILDSNLRTNRYNSEAAKILPSIRGAYGDPVYKHLPDSIETTGNASTFSGEVDAAIDGEDRTYAIESESIVGEGGQSLGHIIQLRDVTEVEEYAADLERQTEQLEEFTSIVSHDLRNPLNVARGNAQLLNGEVDEKDKKKVVEALDRMENIISDSLDLARQGQAIDKDEITEVKLIDVVEDSWEMSDVAAASLRVDLTDEGEPITVKGDPDRLQRMFENLFRNSVDHGPSDVTIRVGHFDDGFYVEDTGPGIPKNKQGQVFEKKFTTAEDGTGLGLSIVDSIVKAHGWDISVGESPESGARFIIEDVSFVAPAAESSLTAAD